VRFNILPPTRAELGSEPGLRDPIVTRKYTTPTAGRTHIYLAQRISTTLPVVKRDAFHFREPRTNQVIMVGGGSCRWRAVASGVKGAGQVFASRRKKQKPNNPLAAVRAR